MPSPQPLFGESFLTFINEKNCHIYLNIASGSTALESDAERIWHEKVTQALRQAGGVQFLSLLPGAVHVIYSEAVTFGHWDPEKKKNYCR